MHVQMFNVALVSYILNVLRSVHEKGVTETKLASYSSRD